MNWKRMGMVIGLFVAFGGALLQPRLAAGQGLSAVTPGSPYIGQEYPVSDFSSAVPASGEHPALAFALPARRYLAVWESLTATRAIAARLLGEDGRFMDEAFLVSSGTRERLRPAVAYNAADREFLVIWMQDASGDGSRYEIWGQRLTENGLLVDMPFLISADRTLSLWSPRLVWAEASNQYLVVWESRDSSDIPTSIGLKLLLANGDSIAGMTLSASSVEPENPDVVYNPLDNEYLVVWTQGNPDGRFTLVGSRRDLYANRLGASPFSIFTSTRYLSNSRAAWSDSGYQVVFEQAYSSYDHDVYLASLDHLASSFSTPIGLAQTWREERFPQLAYLGSPMELWIAYRYEGATGTQLILRSISGPEEEPDTGIEALLSERAGWNFTQLALSDGVYGALALYAGGLADAAPHLYARGFWPIQAYLPLIQSR